LITHLSHDVARLQGDDRHGHAQAVVHEELGHARFVPENTNARVHPRLDLDRTRARSPDNLGGHREGRAHEATRGGRRRRGRPARRARGVNRGANDRSDGGRESSHDALFYVSRVGTTSAREREAVDERRAKTTETKRDVKSRKVPESRIHEGRVSADGEVSDAAADSRALSRRAA
jgi:hypothetical protein